MNPFGLLHVLLTVAFCGVRIATIGHANDFAFNCFKDAAHLYIGGLNGAFLYTLQAKPIQWHYLGLAGVLSVVEVGCAIASRI